MVAISLLPVVPTSPPYAFVVTVLLSESIITTLRLPRNAPTGADPGSVIDTTPNKAFGKTSEKSIVTVIWYPAPTV